MKSCLQNIHDNINKRFETDTEKTLCQFFVYRACFEECWIACENLCLCGIVCCMMCKNDKKHGKILTESSKKTTI